MDDAFEAWLAAAVARHSPPLAFSEVRKGVQALSSLYVERRRGADLSARAAEGEGKRAALATFYAPLHFLATRLALANFGPSLVAGVRRVHDLGCGTGAVGAAVASACRPPAEVLAVDRSGWALGEAARTLRAFGLRGRTRRANLAQAMPRAGRGELVCLGWAVNELEAPARDTVLAALVESAGRGAGLLVLEPLATAVSPWWSEWSRSLAAAGASERIVRGAIERPAWIARLDEASGLDHSEVGARALGRFPEPRPAGVVPGTGVAGFAGT